MDSRRETRLRAPVFEIGLKGYAYGAEAVRLARAADRLCQELGVSVIFDPQCVDISAVARETRHLLVFAQHMDPVAVGRGAGSVLPEAIREAGAVGTMLNHSERRMTLADINRAIRRAHEVGLATMVCADSPEEAAAVAQLGPDIVLAEPPELIATSRSAATEMRGFVERTVEMVGRIDPDIIVMCGAGVQTPDDVAQMMALGVGGTGSSSGVLKAADPIAKMQAMLAAMKQAWMNAHPEDDPDARPSATSPHPGRTPGTHHSRGSIR
jgi:triosephosphate isomerase